MNPYTVIIPSCTEANVLECARSFAAADPFDIESWPSLRVVANGALLDRGSLDFLDGLNLWYAMSVFDAAFSFPAAANLGVEAIPEDHDILLLNDDTRLLRSNGFDLLRDAAYAHLECGLMFPSVTGCTGNREQITQPGGGVRYARRHVVPFIGVYIRRAVWNQIGPMDERFCLDYGCEDNDYCYRVKQAGLELGIFDGCVIEHGVLPSTYRAGGNRSFKKNAELFRLKHGVSLWDLP